MSADSYGRPLGTAPGEAFDRPKRSGVFYRVIDPTARRLELQTSTRETIGCAVVGILGAAMLGFFIAWLLLGGVG